ncbi:diaminopimelate decarboxylase [Candidatus Bandiella euplotis]|uniref:Diaminopimelate decarboxylase n=1 Tax=Candidatus Bandiella euplotis TaxID=1664265 RepID=A0ABZ0UIK5_9RICK|nr:diaminopimelate decarboxylase [Candidatus Bandiella woodruffii]WPX95933.1 Diaminopimelate decarboxylase [Candidatus Bandiella woodruffii]
MQKIDYFEKNSDLLAQIIKDVGSPVFVTDKSALEQRVSSIKAAFGDNCLLYYAIKANFNPSIVNVLKSAGIDGIETISPYEIELAKKLGFANAQILFTGNNADWQELDIAKASGATVNIGSMSELNYYAGKYHGSNISIRVNPGFGDGEFKQVVTGGVSSKFGILHTQIEEALSIIRTGGINLVGLHCHLGSGIYSTDNFAPMVEYMFNLANGIESVQFIDIGGGFGVRYRQSDEAIDLAQFADVVSQCYAKYPKLRNNGVKIILEPGKYLVAESAFLLTKITNLREQHGVKIVGVDTGFNHIIRPALYGAYHHMINISKPYEDKELVKVVGNICESTDVLNEEVEISRPQEGDVIAILTAGAYCASMSSLYNLRPYAAEVLLEKHGFTLIRRRLSFQEMFGSLGFVP